MRRVASLHLPMFAIERVRRAERSSKEPLKPRLPAALPIDDDPGACSVPRGGGWRPGAKWARAQVDAQIAALPKHRRPAARELGRHSEAAGHPFKSQVRRANQTFVEAITPHRQPLVLSEPVGRTLLAAAVCPDAAALGLSTGMAIAHARALVSDLDIRAHDRAADELSLRRLALHAATHWTPIAAASSDGLLLDLTGTAHLHGGEERFCRRVVRFLKRLGFTGRIAVADTVGAAHAIARYSGRAMAIVPVGQGAQSIAALPVAALRLEDRAVDAAKRFGLDRVGDLLGLPRAPLARRLGRPAIERLDQALGRIAEPIDPVLPRDPVVVERRLLEPIATAEAILQVAGDLCDDLSALLRTRGLGARAIRLSCLRVDGGEQHVAFGTAKATRDPRHLLRLVSLRIDRIEPGFGIEAMRMEALRTETLSAAEMPAILAGDPATPDIASAIDQLAGRVGSAALFRISAFESDVPERAVRRIGPLEAPISWPAYHRPARLLRRPEPLHRVIALLPDAPPRRFEWRGTTHRVVAGDGPERIHGEWWRRDGEVWAVRDYFRVEDETGARFWVFRRGDGVDSETGDLSWYLHGLFG